MAPHITPDQADEFAIGAMESEIAELVALHVDGCDACRELVAESRRVAAGLSLGLPLARPPSGLKRKVMREAGISRPGPLTWAARIATAGAGVAAVTVAIAAFAGMVSVRGQIGHLEDKNVSLQRQINDALAQEVEIKAVTHRLSEAERQSAELQEDAQGDRDLLLAIISPESDVAEVFAVDESAAIGRFVWDRQQKRVWFVASRLQARPAGETYQLWVNAQGKYVSIGTFNADERGFVRFQTWVPESIDAYESAVVTIERAGGAKERSGPGVFVADLSRFQD
ncbi:MAG: anti-sigma factor domain-containing protein [Dehalococcoidia bacterium]